MYRVEPDGSNLKCRFTPLSVGSHTFIGKKCVVESAGIGCNVRIDEGCVLVRFTTLDDIADSQATKYQQTAG